MNDKQLIVIVAAIICGCCIIAGALVYSSWDKANDVNATAINNTTNSAGEIKNVTEDTQNTQSSASKSSSGDGSYKEWCDQAGGYITINGYDDLGDGYKGYNYKSADGVVYTKIYDSNGRECTDEYYM